MHKINFMGSFNEIRDTNIKPKEILNQSSLNKSDLIKLFYNLSPNSLLNLKDSILRLGDNTNSVQLLDEDKLNSILIATFSLYTRINDFGLYYDNRVDKTKPFMYRSFSSYPISIYDLPIDYDVYYAQKITVPDDAEIHYIGDIHGSLMSLIKLLVSDLGRFIGEDLVLHPKHYLIFTGDIVDYSQLGLECLYLICILKLKNPDNVFICDGNHEDYNMYNKPNEIDYYHHGYQIHLSGEIANEISSEEIKKNIHKLLKLFPAVIFVKYHGSLFQYNHGSHPLLEQARHLQLKEYLMSDKEFLLIDYGNPITYYSSGYSYKWGDFAQVILRVHPQRPTRKLEETQAYLEEFGISCIFTGHQDIIPLTVLANRKINGYDDNFRDINHGYKLFIGYYNLLGFPSIKQLEKANEMKIPYIEEDGTIVPFNSNGTRNELVERLNFPTEKTYQYHFNPSNLNQTNTILETPNRILAMTQSSAGISLGKWISYTSFTTLKLNL